MPFSALLMFMVVISVILPFSVAAILWPSALARLNAAALRTLPVAASRSQREQAASNSTPGMTRFTGVVGFCISLVLGINCTRIVLDRGIEDIDAASPSWIAWPAYAIGFAQAILGISLIIGSRRFFERLRGAFAKDGADLRRWMIIVLGAVALAMAAVSMVIGTSLV